MKKNTSRATKKKQKIRKRKVPLKKGTPIQGKKDLKNNYVFRTKLQRGTLNLNKGPNIPLVRYDFKLFILIFPLKLQEAHTPTFHKDLPLYEKTN